MNFLKPFYFTTLIDSVLGILILPRESHKMYELIYMIYRCVKNLKLVFGDNGFNNKIALFITIHIQIIR